MLTCISLMFSIESASTSTYTLSLHDALPIFSSLCQRRLLFHEIFFTSCILKISNSKIKTTRQRLPCHAGAANTVWLGGRSEEHTSELQSLRHLVCRLLLEKKNTTPHIR